MEILTYFFLQIFIIFDGLSDSTMLFLMLNSPLNTVLLLLLFIDSSKDNYYFYRLDYGRDLLTFYFV